MEDSKKKKKTTTGDSKRKPNNLARKKIRKLSEGFTQDVGMKPEGDIGWIKRRRLWPPGGYRKR